MSEQDLSTDVLRQSREKEPRDWLVDGLKEENAKMHYFSPVKVYTKQEIEQLKSQ